MKIFNKLSLMFLVTILPAPVQAACPLGSLSPVLGSPFPAGDGPFSIAYSPLVSGNLFLAVPNLFSNDVSVYAANTTTGVLTPVLGSPFPAGSLPHVVAFSPLVFGGLFAAVTNTVSGDISVYQVDETTGVFTPIAGSPFTAGIGIYGIAYSPLIGGNLFAAVTNSLTDTVLVYQIDVNTGAFTPVSGSPFPTLGTQPNDIAFSPVVSGNLFAATVHRVSNTISVFQVDTNTGFFTQVPGSPFPTGSLPAGIAFSPLVSGGLFAAVPSVNLNNVSVYSVNTTTGVFTPVSGSPFPTAPGTNPSNVTFSSLLGGNLFAFVVNGGSNDASMFQVDVNTGAFTPVSGSPFPSGGAVPNDGAFSPFVTGGLFAATANVNSDNVSVFQVNTIVPIITTPSFYIKKGMSVTINATIMGGVPPFEVVWQDGFTQITNNFSVSRTVTPSVTTNYFIQTVTDADGCIAGPSNTVTIGVIPCPSRSR